jgi:phosphoribosylformylglycinamidine synthase
MIHSTLLPLEFWSSTSMLILRGAPALSRFRKHRLLSQCQELLPELNDIFAQFIHFAEITESLSESEMKILQQILFFGPSRKSEQDNQHIYLVLPRPGTISPW